MRTMLIAVAAVLLALPIEVAEAGTPAAPQVGMIPSAEIDASGRLVIVSSSGQATVVQKDAGQTSLSTPLTSPARTAVAAQALYPNEGGSSYDIPLQLVVVARGKIHRFKGNGLPIFRWGFADGGTRIAYGQEPVHAGCEIHYELREIDSERLIDSIDVPEPCGQIPDPEPVKIPPWVSELNSKKP